MSTEPAGQELDVRETFKRASEFAPHVTVTDETFFSHGWQPLTITICQSLWFLPADATFDIPFLVDWYEKLGWKGANGKPLGAKVVRREIGLIRDAGYVTVTRLRGEDGTAVGIQYSVSQRRSDQPQGGSWVPVIPGTEEIRRSHHMAPMATRGESPQVVNGEKPSSDHMAPMATRGESPQVVNGAKPQVAPRGTNGVPPPHPPEVVVTTSPYPLTDGARSHPSQTEGEGNGFAAEEIQAAEAFLLKLPNPWTVGAATARKHAPDLLAAMHDLGWPRITEVDLKLLTRTLLTDPPKHFRAASILPIRIADLRLYETVQPRRPDAQAEQRPPLPQNDPDYKPGTRSVGDLLALLKRDDV